MIVGYGFRDEHINDTLMRSINRGLKLFVIDPQGADVGAATNNLPKHAVGYQRTAFEESPQQALIGASRRPLSSTLAGDHVEYRKIERFFREG
jgi:hypothetical protein